jgi:hypothetical protein
LPDDALQAGCEILDAVLMSSAAARRS